MILIALTGLLFFFAGGAYAKSQPDSCLSHQDTILHKAVYLQASTAPEPEEGLTSFISSAGKHIHSAGSVHNLASYNSKTFIAFVVETNGSIGGIRAVYSMGRSGHIFDQSIITYLKKYKGKWRPATCDGTRVPFLVIIPFTVDISE